MLAIRCRAIRLASLGLGLGLGFIPGARPYREWPESGLSKYEDIKNALSAHIEAADYFFFMDVRGNFDIMLGPFHTCTSTPCHLITRAV